MNSDSDSSLRNNDVNNRRLNIIDFLSTYDSLLGPISSNHQNSENESGYTLNSKKFEDAATKIEQWEDEPQTSEKKTLKKPTYNLRKSLSWDSVFFTNVGVLDPDELSSIIEVVEKESDSELKSCSTSLSPSMKFFFNSYETDTKVLLFYDVLENIAYKVFDKIPHDPFREVESESKSERSSVRKHEPNEIHTISSFKNVSIELLVPQNDIHTESSFENVFVEPDFVNLNPTFKLSPPAATLQFHTHIL